MTNSDNASDHLNAAQAGAMAVLTGITLLFAAALGLATVGVKGMWRLSRGKSI